MWVEIEDTRVSRLLPDFSDGEKCRDFGELRKFRDVTLRYCQLIYLYIIHNMENQNLMRIFHKTIRKDKATAEELSQAILSSCRLAPLFVEKLDQVN